MITKEQRKQIANKFNKNDVIFIDDNLNDHINANAANQNILNILTVDDYPTGCVVLARFYIEHGHIADDVYDECSQVEDLMYNAEIDFDFEAEAYGILCMPLEDAVKKFNKKIGATLFTPDTFNTALKEHGCNCTYDDLKT